MLNGIVHAATLNLDVILGYFKIEIITFCMHSNVIVFTRLSQCMGIYMCKSLHIEMRIYPWDPVSLLCKAQKLCISIKQSGTPMSNAMYY